MQLSEYMCFGCRYETKHGFLWPLFVQFLEVICAESNFPNFPKPIKKKGLHILQIPIKSGQKPFTAPFAPVATETLPVHTVLQFSSNAWFFAWVCPGKTFSRRAFARCRQVRPSCRNNRTHGQSFGNKPTLFGICKAFPAAMLHGL